MSTVQLLINEIEPRTRNDRTMRENLRRIKQYLDDVQAGNTTLVTFTTIGGSPSAFTNTDQYDVTADGQTIFNLSGTPSKPATTRMLINGLEQTYGTHFTVSGNILTFDDVAAGFSLELSNEFGQPDHVVVHYMT